jgi:hypothetical protein
MKVNYELNSAEVKNILLNYLKEEHMVDIRKVINCIGLPSSPVKFVLDSEKEVVDEQMPVTKSKYLSKEEGEAIRPF